MRDMLLGVLLAVVLAMLLPSSLFCGRSVSAPVLQEAPPLVDDSQELVSVLEEIEEDEDPKEVEDPEVVGFEQLDSLASSVSSLQEIIERRVSDLEARVAELEGSVQSGLAASSSVSAEIQALKAKIDELEKGLEAVQREPEPPESARSEPEPTESAQSEPPSPPKYIPEPSGWEDESDPPVVLPPVIFDDETSGSVSRPDGCPETCDPSCECGCQGSVSSSRVSSVRAPETVWRISPVRPGLDRSFELNGSCRIVNGQVICQ
ncbi:MAG: hypothetical protein KatS3mg109_0031 [Pirellulaceae bacterium]|nr:MAG: hypothetical protein KatS3mg109_0031 [Pirellulaceae bacterium]